MADFLTGSVFCEVTRMTARCTPRRASASAAADLEPPWSATPRPRPSPRTLTAVVLKARKARWMAAPATATAARDPGDSGIPDAAAFDTCEVG